MRRGRWPNGCGGAPARGLAGRRRPLTLDPGGGVPKTTPPKNSWVVSVEWFRVQNRVRRPPKKFLCRSGVAFRFGNGVRSRDFFLPRAFAAFTRSGGFDGWSCWGLGLMAFAGRPRVEPTAEQLRVIGEMRGAGATFEEVGAALGMGRWWVRQEAKRAGLWVGRGAAAAARHAVAPLPGAGERAAVANWDQPLPAMHALSVAVLRDAGLPIVAPG